MQTEYFDFSTLSEDNAYHIGPFRIKKCLGKGTTGIVCLAIHTISKLEVAIKIIKKKYLNEKKKRWAVLKREIAILRLVNHPNIIRFYDVLETEKRIYIISEHIKGGELFDYILARKRLSEEESIRLLGQMVMGLEHCHAHWVCHRDLKPENLLLDEKKNIKIVDFGFAQVTRRWGQNLLNTPCGSPHYTAPEVIAGTKVYDGMQSDVWSLGVILFAMTTGMLPFNHTNVTILLELVLAGNYDIPYYVSPLVSDLINKMLVSDPQRRIKMRHIRKHRVFKHYFPSLYIASLDPVPSSLFSHSQMVINTPWNGGKSLDIGILQDLQSLGWGNLDDIKNMLINDNLEIDSKQINPNQRIDRAMYLLFERRKITRVESLKQLTPRPISSKKKKFIFPTGVKTKAISTSRRHSPINVIQNMTKNLSFRDESKKSNDQPSYPPPAIFTPYNDVLKTQKGIDSENMSKNNITTKRCIEARFLDPTTPRFHRIDIKSLRPISPISPINPLNATSTNKPKKNN